MIRLRKVIISVFLLAFSLYGKGQYSIDSLYQLLNHNLDSTSTIEKLNSILSSKKFSSNQDIMKFTLFKKGFYFQQHNYQLDSAKYYFDLALNTNTLNNKINSRIFLRLGDVAKMEGESSAYQYYVKALKSIEKCEPFDSLFYHKIKISIGGLKVLEGEYEEALNLFNTSLIFFERKRAYEDIALIYGQIAWVYGDKNDFDKAIEYQKKSYELCYHYFQDNLIVEGANLALYYDIRGSKQEALDTLNSLIAFNLRNNNKYSIINVLLSKVGILSQMGNVEAVRLSDSLYKVTNDPGTQAKLMFTISNYYFNIKQYNKALQYVERELAIVSQQGYNYVYENLYFRLATIHEKVGNYKEALNYYKLKDSIKEKIIQDNFVELERKYNVAKEREEKIEALNQKELFERKTIELKGENDRKRFFIILSVIIILSLIILGLIILKAKKNRQLTERITLEQKLLTSQMNPHFISNALGVLQTYIVNNKVEESLTFLSNFAKVSRGILISSKENFIELDEEVAILENYIQLQIKRYENRVNCRFNVDQSLLNNGIIILPMLIQPIIENAFEYGTVNGVGEVEVSIKDKINNIKISVSDKGKGLGNKPSLLKKSYSSDIIKDRITRFNYKRKQKIELYVNSSQDGVVVTINYPKEFLT